MPRTAHSLFFRIDDDRDVYIRKWFLVFVTVIILLIGLSAEASGVEGAVITSTGVVVAVTTPMFAIFMGQLADYSVGVRMILFSHRRDKALMDELGIVSYSEAGKQKERDARVLVDQKIDEFSRIEASLRKSSNGFLSAHFNNCLCNSLS